MASLSPLSPNDDHHQQQQQQTYLRVKRPRHVPSLPLIRVEGIANPTNNKRLRTTTTTTKLVDDHLAALLHQSTYIAAQQQSQSQQQQSFCVWKRIQDDDNGDLNHKRHFVDAVLDDVDDDDDDDDENNGSVQEPRKKKQRRLALTLVASSSSSSMMTTAPPSTTKSSLSLSLGNTKKSFSTAIRILDPCSRLVHDSLQSVINGEISIANHVEFVTHDARLTATGTNWLLYQGPGGTTILHCAALRNDVDGARAILQLNSNNNNNVTVMMLQQQQKLLNQVDTDHGQTPYQLAMAIGHVQVAQFLESYLDTNDDDDDYEYDVFLLDSTNHPPNDNDDTTTTVDDVTTNAQSVELRGGIGYWNQDGQLVLETLEEIQDDDKDSNDNDDDEDSNCEDHMANDYPDDEEDEEENEDDWSTDSHDDEDLDFRRLPMLGVQIKQTNFVTGSNGDADEVYDVQYGLYEPNGGATRLYAYDPDGDDSSDQE